MSTIVTYTDLEFVHNILMSAPKDLSLSDYFEDRLKLYQEMFDLLFKKSNLYLDITESELDDKLAAGDELLRILIRKLQGGLRHFDDFHFMKTEIEYSEHYVQPNSLHCYEDGVLSTNTGLFKMTKATWMQNLNKICNHKVITVSPIDSLNGFTSWSSLMNEDERLPSNTCIIYDPYLNKSLYSLDNTIIDLLNFCLPKESVFTFHLTFLVKSDDEVKLQESYTRLKTYLEETYRYKISCQFLLNNEFHDRGIISNYYWIDCGHSLDLTNANGNVKGNKNTTIKLFTINSSPYSTFFGLINSISRLVDASNLIGSEFRNRLLTKPII